MCFIKNKMCAFKKLKLIPSAWKKAIIDDFEYVHIDQQKNCCSSFNFELKFKRQQKLCRSITLNDNKKLLY